MGPGQFTSFPPRLWAVDIVTGNGRPTATCRVCGPLADSHPPRTTLRGTVLRHLARHARSDLTPAHLRTCQCGRRGCPWHRPHHGCHGPIVLALTRSSDSRTWQLADACHRCCTTMPATATVLEPPPARRHTAHQGSCHSTQHTHEDNSHDADEEYALVWETPETCW
jgi:hypothetical protein